MNHSSHFFTSVRQRAFKAADLVAGLIINVLYVAAIVMVGFGLVYACYLAFRELGTYAGTGTVLIFLAVMWVRGREGRLRGAAVREMSRQY